MIGNVEFDHKFKLGDTVWLKANEIKYENCNKCNSTNAIKKSVVKVIKAKIISINVQCSIVSYPDTTSFITYNLRRDNGLDLFNCREGDLFKSKNKAKSSVFCFNVSGL